MKKEFKNILEDIKPPVGTPFRLFMIKDHEQNRTKEWILNKAFKKWQQENPEVVDRILEEALDNYINPQ